MRGRMSKADRIDHLLLVIQSRYSKAQSPSEFTAPSLAREAGVSTVWFYALVGREFKALRSNLSGPARSGESLMAKLRSEVERLRKKTEELKATYEASLRGKLAGAIGHIEALDSENRMLREKVALLEKRLEESEVILIPEICESDTK